MHAAADRLEFVPPPSPGLMRALGLAVLAHALLLAALTWGVSWKRDAPIPTVEAELWSSIPHQAAPKLAEVPPEPEPEPEPAPAPALPQADPGPSAAEIALAREKERKLKKKLEQEQRQKEKLALEKKRQQEKLAQDKKAIEEKKKQALEAQKKDKLKTQEEARKLEQQRQKNLQRMAGLAGASGGPHASSTALKSAGPSASYAGRIIARVRPNIVFTENITDNPSAEVEVHTAPDGTIISRKLTQSSAVKSWDEAVLKAIDKTGKLPRDVDGQVPPALVISFRPKD